MLYSEVQRRLVAAALRALPPVTEPGAETAELTAWETDGRDRAQAIRYACTNDYVIT